MIRNLSLRNFRLYIAVCAMYMLAACSGLSKEAKQIVGVYYNPELSQTEPVMELRSNATCTVRAIKPGVLSYSVDGEWNVKNDSIVFVLDPSTLKVDGDKALVGDIPVRYSRKLADYNDFNLQLEQDGVMYLYQRRSE